VGRTHGKCGLRPSTPWTHIRLFTSFPSSLLLYPPMPPSASFLGVRPPKLFKVRVQEREALLALSTKPWLGYTYQDRFTLAPLAFEALDYGSPFCSEACPEGIVAIAGNFLRSVSGGLATCLSSPLCTDR